MKHHFVDEPRKTVEVDISGLNVEWLRQYAKRPGNQKGAMSKAVYRLAKAVENSRYH